MGQADLVAVLNRLTSVENDGDPTIASIQGAVPDLGRMDWINRFGPADAWAGIASGLDTKTLERLIKILVVAEREFEWLGGSVAAPIWLFRAYQERSDGDANSLGDWVLRNRGRNDYIPFGRMTSACSLGEWHVEQRLREQRRGSHRLREQEQEDAKRQRMEQSVERSAEREEASQRRHGELQVRIGQLQALDAHARLSRIATDAMLPLEVIPPNLIADCIPVAASLSDEVKRLLLGRIDRRSGKVWKKLRVALTA